jgi:hypothetical protein
LQRRAHQQRRFGPFSRNAEGGRREFAWRIAGHDKRMVRSVSRLCDAGTFTFQRSSAVVCYILLAKQKVPRFKSVAGTEADRSRFALWGPGTRARRRRLLVMPRAGKIEPPTGQARGRAWRQRVQYMTVRPSGLASAQSRCRQGGFRIFASLDLALSNPLQSVPVGSSRGDPGKLLQYRQPQGSGANHRRG